MTLKLNHTENKVKDFCPIFSVQYRLAAYNLLQKNIISSTKLKEKAVKLREKASTLIKASRVSIAAEQDRLAWKSMVTYEINERERKRNQNR